MNGIFVFLGVGLATMLVSFPRAIPERAWWALSFIAVVLTIGGILTTPARL